MSSFLKKIEAECPIIWSERHNPELASLFNVVAALDGLSVLTPNRAFTGLTIKRGSGFKLEKKEVAILAASFVRQLQAASELRAENCDFFSDALAALNGLSMQTPETSVLIAFEKQINHYKSAIRMALTPFYEKIILPNAEAFLTRYSTLTESATSRVRRRGPYHNSPNVAVAFGKEIDIIEAFYQLKAVPVLLDLINGFLKTYTPPDIDWALKRTRLVSSSVVAPAIKRNVFGYPDENGRSSGQIEPILSFNCHFAPWIYMPALKGEANSLEKIKRRLQAYAVYGIVFNALLDPEVSRLIDAGRPIERKIGELLDLNGYQVRFIKEVAARADLLHTLRGTFQTTYVISRLATSGVPISNWPEIFRDFNKALGAPTYSYEPHLWLDKFRPDRSVVFSDTLRSDWKSSNRPASNSLPEFYWQPLPGEDTANSQANVYVDACHDIERDLIALTSPSRQNGTILQVCSMVLSDAVNRPRLPRADALEPSRVAARDFYRVIHAAIVGDRTRSGFRKQLLEVHKFAASIAAKRREILGFEEAWPALFSPWKSEDGRREIAFLTSTSALVEEGLRMRHCVGSYDQQCAQGTTHIASVKVDGDHVATLELRVELMAKEKTLSINKGQFASVRNSSPPAEAQSAFSEFMRDVSLRRVVPNTAAVASVIKRKQEERDITWPSLRNQGRGLTIDEAEGLWPIYRATLISSHPQAGTLKEWREMSGIEAAFERLYAACAARLRECSKTDLNRIQEIASAEAPQEMLAL